MSLPKFGQTLASLLAFLLAWEVLARSGVVHISLFPPPTVVARALIEMLRSGELARDVGASLWRALVGWAFGVGAGIVVGLLTGRIETIRGFLAPIIQLFRPLPPVAVIPLVIVWFGIGEVSKVFSIAFAVFFPVWIATHLGTQSIPNSWVWTAQTFKPGRVQLLLRVIFPAALPYVVPGLRTGMAIAFVMVFVSELAGASSGVGYQISVSHLAYRVDRMMASLAVLAVLGASADFLTTRALYLALPWLKYSVQK